MEIMNKAKNLLIAGVMVFAFLQLRHANRLEKEIAALKLKAGQLETLAEANAALSNRLSDATENLASGKRELARLRSSATAVKQLQDENRQLADQRNQLIESHRKSRSVEREKPKQEAIPWMDQRYGLGTSDRTGAARDWGLALKLYADKNGGRYPEQLADATPFLRIPEDRMVKALQRADRFELLYRGTRDQLRQMPGESTIILRERTALQSEDGTWTKVYGMADGTGQVKAQPGGGFETYERVRMPRVVQP